MEKHTDWTKISIFAILGILLATCIVWVCMQIAFASNSASDDRMVVVTDGEEHTQRIPLTQDGTYTISTSLGENTIEIKDMQVSMINADCPGHDCIEQGAISKEGEIIVCLPHQLIVNIEGGQATNIDSVAS